MLKKIAKQLLIIIGIVTFIFCGALLVQYLMNGGAFLFKSQGAQTPFNSPFTWIFIILGVIWGAGTKYWRKYKEKVFTESLLKHKKASTVKYDKDDSKEKGEN